MMSSEQESYTSNICHQMQGTTIHIGPLLRSPTPHDHPTETGCGFTIYRFPKTTHPPSLLKGCHLIHSAQGFFSHETT